MLPSDSGTMRFTYFRGEHARERMREGLAIRKAEPRPEECRVTGVPHAAQVVSEYRDRMKASVEADAAYRVVHMGVDESV